MGTGDFTKLNTDLLPSSWKAAYLTLDPAVPECSDFTFRLRAMRGGAPSPYSNEATYRHGIRPPYLNSPWSASGGIQVSWTNNSSVADTLLLERGRTQDNGVTYQWSPIPNVPLSANSCLDTGPFTEGARYGYRLTLSKGTDKAQSVSGYSVAIGMAPPSGLVATPLVEGVRLNWTNSSQVATEVAIMRAPGMDSYSSFQVVAVLPVGTTSYEDSQLATGYYTYRIENRKAGVGAATSASVQVVTLPPQNGASVTPTILRLPQAGIIRRSSKGEWFLSGTYQYDILVREPSGTSWVDYRPTNATSWSAPYFLLDSQDHPHVVYTRSVVQGTQEVAIMHAWKDAVGWKTEEIARRTLYSSSALSAYTFALDAQDRLHLLWLKSGGNVTDLEYAIKDQAGTWIMESPTNVPTQSLLGSYKLMVDPTGQPHVLIGAWQELFHLTRSGGAWVRESVPSNGVSVGWYDFLAGLAPGPDSVTVLAPRAHQPYDGSFDLMMFRKEAGIWLPEEVVYTTTGYSSINGTLAANNSGTRFGLYCPSSSGNMLRVWTAGVWTNSLVGPSNYGTPVLGFGATDKLWLLLPAGWGSGENDYPYVLYREQP